MNKLENGSFGDAQNIDTSSTIKCIKITYFNNWILIGTSGKQLLIYTIISGTSYTLYETITYSAEVSDIDLSYDTRTLIVGVQSFKFYIYAF